MGSKEVILGDITVLAFGALCAFSRDIFRNSELLIIDFSPNINSALCMRFFAPRQRGKNACKTDSFLL